MRRSFLWFSCIALWLPAGLGPASAQVPPVPAAAVATPRTITVAASAEVRAAPDRAVVQLGVRTQASNAQAAMAQNDAIMARVVAALKQLGIPDANLQTSALNLQPVYNPPPPQNPSLPPQLAGFEATDLVTAEPGALWARI